MEQTDNIAYNASISVTMKRHGKPKLYSYNTNDSSIPLCISYLADNDDKSIGNITYGFSCTWQKWQAPNIITAGRASLLTEV